MGYIKSAGVLGEDQNEYKYFESVSPDEAEAFAESLGSEIQDNSLPKFRPIFLSQNAITLSNKAQIVIRFYGEPDQIHSNYDFVHATCYYDFAKSILHTPLL